MSGWPPEEYLVMKCLAMVIKQNHAKYRAELRNLSWLKFRSERLAVPPGRRNGRRDGTFDSPAYTAPSDSPHQSSVRRTMGYTPTPGPRVQSVSSDLSTSTSSRLPRRLPRASSHRRGVPNTLRKAPILRRRGPERGACLPLQEQQVVDRVVE